MQQENQEIGQIKEKGKYFFKTFKRILNDSTESGTFYLNLLQKHSLTGK